jgi:membrane-associated phospholipid phosphatase
VVKETAMWTDCRALRCGSRLTVVVAACLLATGGCAFSDRNWVELGEAVDRAEHRNLALAVAGESASDTQSPSVGNASPSLETRRIDPAALAMARRLVRSTDTILEQADVNNAFRNTTGTQQENLSHSLIRQTGLPTGRPNLDGTSVLRTDFVTRQEEDSTGPDVLMLVEMAGAEGSADAAGQHQAGSAHPAASQPDRGPLPGFKDTVWRDVKRIHLDLWKDTKRVYWNPTNVVILLAAGGVSAALRPEVDDDIEDFYDQHHTMSDGWRQTFGFLGNPAFHFALAGAWYLAGQQAQSTKTYEVGKTLFSALIINGVSTMALKLAACTDSPNGEPLAWPSGHTSSAFTVAAVMHQAYGPLAGIPLYGVSAMVALSRLDDREHSLSDCVFGAALGLVIGHTVASGHRPQIFGGDLIPYADPTTGSGGIAWFKMTK